VPVVSYGRREGLGNLGASLSLDERQLSQILQRIQDAVARDVGSIVQQHEIESRKQIAAGAQKLLSAGVPRREVERRVQAAVQKIPAVQARKAVAERRRTGQVSRPTRDALRKAQAAHPQVRGVVERAAAVGKREVQRQIGKVASAGEREVQKRIEKATAPARAAANDLVKSVPPALRGPAKALVDSALKGKLDPKAVQQLGEKEAKKVLNQYAQKYGKAALEKLVPSGVKLPGGIDVGGAVDMLVSGKVTAEGVKELIYDSTKGSAETFIRGATGLPITLPKDFSLKSIAGSITSLIPTDLNGVIDKGLLVASQAVSGVLTAALAGSAIGSVIPGLGTVVGIGVALGVNALKGALKQKPPPYARKCPTKVPCPKVPQLSPIELLPWIATQQVAVYQAVASDRKKSYCGSGAAVECTYRLNTLTERVAEILNPSGVHANMLTKGSAADPTKSTAYSLGLPQLQKLIPLYERAPKSRAWYQSENNRPGYKTIVQLPNTALVTVLAQMKARKSQLDSLVARSKTVSRMDFGPVEAYRMDLGKELNSAIQQAALSPGRETQAWVGTLGEMWKAMVKRQEELRAVNQKRISDAHTKRAQLAKDPNWKPKQYVVE
jgi:hypothetical protein